jgi:Putative Flp pilus-assembly TadE/G-like
MQRESRSNDGPSHVEEAASARFRLALTRLWRDESGSYVVYMSVLLPVLIGVAGLGAEGTMMLSTHRSLQAAADSAAVSAASYYAAQTTALSSPTSTQLLNQAKGVSAKYGFVAGAGGVSVTMNNPPASGNFTANGDAFEVIVSQPHTPMLSAYWFSSAATVSARAVALINTSGGTSADCALALGKSSTGANVADAITGNGNARLNVTGCSVFSNSSNANSIFLGPKGSAAINLIKTGGNLAGNLGTVGGDSISGGSNIESCTSVSGAACSGASALTANTGAASVPDPYATATIPSAGTCATIPAAYQCKSGSNTGGWCFNSVNGPVSLSPGTYCGGISISKGTPTLNLSSGVYILASEKSSPGLTDSKGTVTLNGTGVTLVFTSADGTYPVGAADMMDIPNDMTLNLTAPTTGSTAGFVIMGDRSMPLGTAGQSTTPAGSQFVVENGATANLNGIVYLPNGAMSFEGNGGTTADCAQFITNVLDLNNSGNLNIDCTSGGGGAPSTLIGSVPLLVE